MDAKAKFRDRKGTAKNFSNKDFARLSDELSGAICLKRIVLLGSALEWFRKFFGAVRAILGLWGSFWLLTNVLTALESSNRRLPKGDGQTRTAKILF